MQSSCTSGAFFNFNKLINMNKYYWILLLFSTTLFAQITEVTKEEITVAPQLKGTLFSPLPVSQKPILAIIIAGSGPTNRSGNQIGVHNNSLKYLSEELSNKGISVFSFDKRAIAQLISGETDESKMNFEDNSTDVNEIVSYFKNQNRYSKIVLIGHSEGSLIGMLSATKNVDGFVSIAGAERSIDEIVVDQVVKQSPSTAAEAKFYFDELKLGKTIEVTSQNQFIKSFFRKSILNYLQSWVKINPQTEIKKLTIPVLLLNGTKDLQVPESEAKILKSAQPNAQLVIINNMNHVLKNIEGDEAENKASYNNPKLPIATELTASIVDFIGKM